VYNSRLIRRRWRRCVSKGSRIDLQQDLPARVRVSGVAEPLDRQFGRCARPVDHAQGTELQDEAPGFALADAERGMQERHIHLVGHRLAEPTSKVPPVLRRDADAWIAPPRHFGHGSDVSLTRRITRSLRQALTSACCSNAAPGRPRRSPSARLSLSGCPFIRDARDRSASGIHLVRDGASPAYPRKIVRKVVLARGDRLRRLAEPSAAAPRMFRATPIVTAPRSPLPNRSLYL